MDGKQFDMGKEHNKQSGQTKASGPITCYDV